MKRAARVDTYRGFVFASLASEGPTLTEFLGDARIAFDDMCDRSPEGEVEVVPVCHRVVQQSNWKFFMENQLDALHPSVTHQSTGVAASKVERALKAEGKEPPLYYHYLSTFASSFDQWDSVQTVNFPRGHGILKGYMGLRPRGSRHAGIHEPRCTAPTAPNAPSNISAAAFITCSFTRIYRCSRPCSSCAACDPWHPARHCRRSGTFV